MDAECEVFFDVFRPRRETRSFIPFGGTQILCSFVFDTSSAKIVLFFLQIRHCLFVELLLLLRRGRSDGLQLPKQRVNLTIIMLSGLFAHCKHLVQFISRIMRTDISKQRGKS